jgi:hypothetical protein
VGCLWRTRGECLGRTTEQRHTISTTPSTVFDDLTYIFAILHENASQQREARKVKRSEYYVPLYG